MPKPKKVTEVPETVSEEVLETVIKTNSRGFHIYNARRDIVAFAHTREEAEAELTKFDGGIIKSL